MGLNYSEVIMNQTKETIRGLERIEVKYPFEEKLNMEDAKCLWEAKRIIRTLEKAGEELGERKDCNPYGILIHLKSAHSYNEGSADMKAYYEGSELNEDEIEKILFPFLRGLLLRTLAYHGKKITEWDITVCDNAQEELAKAIISARDKKRGE